MPSRQHRAAPSRRRGRADPARGPARAARRVPTRPAASYRAGVSRSCTIPRSTDAALGSPRSRANSRACSTTVRSGRASSPASASGQPLGRAMCLRPARRRECRSRDRRHAASSAGSSNETPPRPGRPRGLPRPCGGPRIGARSESCSLMPEHHRPPLIGRYERFDSIPDHQREHRVGGVFLVARQRLRRPTMRWLSGSRCRADARLSRTFGLGSVLASSANRATTAGAGWPASQSSLTPHARTCSLVDRAGQGRPSRRGRR